MSTPEEACPQGAQPCTGCGQPTIVSLRVGDDDDNDETTPLRPEWPLMLQTKPEARELLLARPTAQDVATVVRTS